MNAKETLQQARKLEEQAEYLMMQTGIVEAEEKLNGILEKLFETRAEIMKIIQKIRDGRQQLILICRYLYYKTWDEIAEKTGYSTRHLLRIHRKGLAAVEEILERGENYDFSEP